MVRFEWAQVVAFDGPAKPPVTPDDILDAPSSKLRLDLQPGWSVIDSKRMDVALVFAADVKNCQKLRELLYGERNGALE